VVNDNPTMPEAGIPFFQKQAILKAFDFSGVIYNANQMDAAIPATPELTV
jgi:hypothetical protein